MMEEKYALCCRRKRMRQREKPRRQQAKISSISPGFLTDDYRHTSFGDPQIDPIILLNHVRFAAERIGHHDRPAGSVETVQGFRRQNRIIPFGESAAGRIDRDDEPDGSVERNRSVDVQATGQAVADGRP